MTQVKSLVVMAIRLRSPTAPQPQLASFFTGSNYLRRVDGALSNLPRNRRHPLVSDMFTNLKRETLSTVVAPEYVEY